MKKIKKLLISSVVMLFAIVCFTFSTSAAGSNANGKWIAAWGTGPTDISIAQYDNVAFIGKDLSARTVITPTASGDKIRLRFSNYYGEAALTLNNVTVAKSKDTDSIEPTKATSTILKSTLTQVTFNGGSKSVTIPIGKEVVSDEITFDVEAMKNIAVSMYIKDSSVIRTMGLSGGTTYLSREDKTREDSFGLQSHISQPIINLISAFVPGFRPEFSLDYGIIRVVPILSGLEIRSDKDAFSVAVIGDSTVANEFPLYLADEINKKYGVHNVGVMGKGIIGNMLCGKEESIGSNLYGENLVNRFENDIASQTGIKYVIVKIGGNDILHPVCGENADESKQPTADILISALKTICDKTHVMGAKVILSTITQWKGTTRDYFGAGASYTRTDEDFEHDWQIAKDVNKWITDPNNTYVDGFVDYIKLSADKNDIAKFDDKYTDDYIHPNSDLQKLWAAKFPMKEIGVHKRIQSIKLSESSKTLYVNSAKYETAVVKATVSPSDAENKKLVWSVDNKSVCEIVKSSNGSVTVKAKKDGIAIVTCKAEDGGVFAKFLVKVKTSPTGVKIKSNLTIYARQKSTLTATVSPSNAYNKAVTWKSSNTKVATVDSKGVVTGVGKGTATITCTTKAEGKTAKCKVTVNKPTDVTSIYTTVSSKKIVKGSSYRITAVISPSNATFKTLKWTSSNTKVATVDSKGVVKAIAPGSATIKCTSTDNPTMYSTVKVSVIIRPTALKLNKTSLSLYKTKTETLKPVFSPSNATEKTVTWTSSNKKVATVDKNGKVTAVSKGTAVITAVSKDGGFRAKCSVTVKNITYTSGVKLNVTSASVTVGKTYKLKPTVSPSNATLKEVSWTSSNKNIATVDSNGVVKGVKAGKVTITCKTKDSGKIAKCEVTVKNVVPSSVSLDKTNLALSVGSSSTIKKTVSPSNAYNKNVTWTSSNPNVATVDKNGKVTAKKVGVAVITCKTQSGGKTAKCRVTVSGIPVKTVSLNKTDLKMDFGAVYQLKATVSPSNATNKKVVWSSSNPNVVTVDSKGNIKAVGRGSAVITCKAADGSGAYKNCNITVYKTGVLGIELNKQSLNMQKGATYKLIATIFPANAVDKRIIWTSSNTSVAKVDANGVVTAVGKGTCQIKARAYDGGYIAVCNITVK